jgi:16S rRNA (cytidine1402-2'-O)-methyltransferase
MPTLFLVATPIGNLEDITLRALRVLGEVGLIAAEDTRTTRRLLNHYSIQNRLISYNEHNKAQRIPYILDALYTADVALVSEAGMPGISDPGFDLVFAASEAGIEVVPIPGASAVLAALVVSALPTRRFHYLGFLPKRRGELKRVLEEFADERSTLVAFESPHRLRETLADMLRTWGDRRIAVCRELTKLHEEVFRGRISQAIEHFSELRGEFTLVVEGRTEEEGRRKVEGRGLAIEEVEAEIRRLREAGVRAREAASQLATASGLPRREVYRLWLKAQSDES